ncbi:MAG: hypothetical protein ACOC9Y_03555 [Chloroflexota bacterium]
MAEHVHHGAPAPTFSLQQLIADSTRRVRTIGVGLSMLEIVLLILAVIGVAAVIGNMAVEGLNDLRPWTYTAVAANYVLSTFMAAPILAALLRFTRSDWRRPLSRIAEIQAATGIVVLIFYIPLLIVIPSSEGRVTWWSNWPWGAPWLFDGVMLVLLVATGYALLWMSSMPDFAITKQQVNEGTTRHSWYTRLAANWQGNVKQWVILRMGLGVLGAFYVILYIWMVSLLYSDFAQVLVPSWRSAVFPSFAVMSSLQSGLAIVIISMYALRRWGGLEQYLGWDYFWAISKLLLTTSLLWFYLWFSEFIIFWYGRLPDQINIIEVVMFDVYIVPMLITLACNFVLPLLILMWNRVRKTVIGPTIVACIVLIGTFFDRIRIFGAGFGTEDPYAHVMDDDLIPSFVYPSVLDILIVVGCIAAAIVSVLLAMRFVPLPSIWELGGGIGLRIRKRFLNHDVPVIGKPD